MNYGLYLAASALRVNQTRQDVIANNLANVNTAGFKRDLLAIRASRSAPEALGLPPHLTAPILDEVGGGLRDDGTRTRFTQGPLIRTGNDLDLALQGQGFFAVQADGEKRYTRDGRFARDAAGQLVTAAGAHPVLDANDQPIRLPSGTASVDARGILSVGETRVSLKIVDFDDPSVLIKAGGNTYVTDGPPVEQPAEATVRNQFIEGSGVEPTAALVEMISAQRCYQAAAKLIQFTDTMLGKAVNDIARIA